MSKEKEARDEFFEYLLALNSVSHDSKFSPHIEPLESDFWSNLEKDIEEKEAPVFLNSSGKTDSSNTPSIQKRVEELGQKVQEFEQKMEYFEDYIHLVMMRGPKGDRGADGADGADFDLTEEDIKNAVKEGVIEGMKEFLSEKI